jgi:hypothetical protein
MQATANYSPQEETEEFDDEEAFGHARNEVATGSGTNPSDENTAILADVLSIVKDVSLAAAVLPQMKKEISQIRAELSEVKTHAENVLSYCRTLMLSSGPPSAREDKRFQQQLLPVSSIVTKDYLSAAVCSTLLKYILGLPLASRTS